MKTELVHSLTNNFEGCARRSDSGAEFWLERDIQHFYFSVQTRKAELIEQRLLDADRVSARKKLSATEHELSEVIFEQVGGTNQDFAVIRSKGDHALFGKSTQAMKSQWKVPDGRPLADFAPTAVRNTLLERRIRPESLLSAEDVKKVEHRLLSEDKKALKKPDALDS